MPDETTYLILAVFPDAASAAAAAQQLPRRQRDLHAAVLLEKDAQGQSRFRDIGLTPRKGAAGGLVLGSLAGLLAGGPGVALAVAGTWLGRNQAAREEVRSLLPGELQQVAASLGADSSALVVVRAEPLSPGIAEELAGLGATLYETAVTTPAATQQDEAYQALLAALAESTGGRPALDPPYPRIHVVVNPVSGKDQPVINTLNRVFARYGIDWEISITRQYGDAQEFARRAAAAGFDLVAGYGGDGTQHEIAIGLQGSGVPLGVLPGGTGNGFANELGIPGTLEAAAELLCTSYNQRQIDIARAGDTYFVQRLFTGIEPEEQTSREDKDKYGTLAYLKRDLRLLREIEDVPYQLTIDGEEIAVSGYKCYVVNSATAGTGLSISQGFKVDDGYLDVFMLSRDARSANAALARFLNLETDQARMYYWRGRSIRIAADTDQPVWMDGEYYGRTPVSIHVLPGELTVAVP